MTVARRAAAPARSGRCDPTLEVERGLLTGRCLRIAALDEVGRGALAGPVSVGAVVVSADRGAFPAGLRDSKMLSADARAALIGPIRAWALDCAVGHAEPEEIDAVGIMAALRIAAHRALAALAGPVDAVLLDGDYDYVSPPAELFPAPAGAHLRRDGEAADVVIPGRARAGQPGAAPAEPFAEHGAAEQFSFGAVHVRVRADRDCASVAAASVLAKVTRDALMVRLDRRFPGFGWAANKGYGTAAHLAAIARVGPCAMHRRSWSLPGGG